MDIAHNMIYVKKKSSLYFKIKVQHLKIDTPISERDDCTLTTVCYIQQIYFIWIELEKS